VSLLAPAGLGLLLLLPPVIAIHLWRVRHRRYTLSSTLLWSRVLSETPLRRPRRLPTRYVLLALEFAALTCGAVALARPSWAASGQHRRLLVAVDTSLGMAATDVRPTRADGTKTAVRALIDGLGPSDTMTLVDVGPTPRVLTTSGDHAALTQALNRLTPNDGPSSLADDAPLLQGLAATGGHTTTSLFAAFGTPPAALATLRRAVPGLRTRLLGGRNDDRGVAGLTVSCSGGACEAYARLINMASRPATVQVTALVDGAGPTQEMTLPPGATPIRLALPATARTLELHLDGHDALPADDIAWGIAPLPARRAALLVTDDPTSALAQALRAIPNLHVKTTTPDDLAIDDEAKGVDLTILDGTGPDLAPPGNLLLINPQQGSAFFDDTGAGPAAVMAVAKGSNLLRDVDIGSLVVSTATRVHLPAWARADIMGNNGPLLFHGTTGGRRVAALTFDPRPGASANASNLATLLAFPTLLQNAVLTLAPAIPSDVTAGQTSPSPVTRLGPILIQPATGRATRVPSSGDLAALPALHPGLYTLAGVAGGSGALAVNAAVPGDPGAASVPLPASAPVAPTVTTPSAITPSEGWAILVLLAMFALSGEWWYYTRHT